MSKIRTGKIQTEEHRRNIAESKRGRPRPDMRKPKSDETKRRMAEARKGTHHSAETRAKMSASHKRRFEKLKCSG